MVWNTELFSLCAGAVREGRVAVSHLHVREGAGHLPPGQETRARLRRSQGRRISRRIQMFFFLQKYISRQNNFNGANVLITNLSIFTVYGLYSTVCKYKNWLLLIFCYLWQLGIAKCRYLTCGYVLFTRVSLNINFFPGNHI